MIEDNPEHVWVRVDPSSRRSWDWNRGRSRKTRRWHLIPRGWPRRALVGSYSYRPVCSRGEFGWDQKPPSTV